MFFLALLLTFLSSSQACDTNPWKELSPHHETLVKAAALREKPLSPQEIQKLEEAQDIYLRTGVVAKDAEGAYFTWGPKSMLHFRAEALRQAGFRPSEIQQLRQPIELPSHQKFDLINDETFLRYLGEYRDAFESDFQRYFSAGHLEDLDSFKHLYSRLAKIQTPPRKFEPRQQSVYRALGRMIDPYMEAYEKSPAAHEVPSHQQRREIFTALRKAYFDLQDREEYLQARVQSERFFEAHDFAPRPSSSLPLPRIGRRQAIKKLYPSLWSLAEATPEILLRDRPYETISSSPEQYEIPQLMRYCLTRPFFRNPLEAKKGLARAYQLPGQLSPLAQRVLDIDHNVVRGLSLLNDLDLREDSPRRKGDNAFRVGLTLLKEAAPYRKKNRGEDESDAFKADLFKEVVRAVEDQQSLAAHRQFAQRLEENPSWIENRRASVETLGDWLQHYTGLLRSAPQRSRDAAPRGKAWVKLLETAAQTDNLRQRNGFAEKAAFYFRLIGERETAQNFMLQAQAAENFSPRSPAQLAPPPRPLKPPVDSGD